MLLRRHILLTGVALACPAIRRTARAATRTLRIGYIQPQQSQLGAGATAFADDLAKRTGGRIAIQQFPDAALGGDVELAKGVQLGSVDLAIITGLGLSSVVPEAGVFNIPFLFRDLPHAYAVFDGPIGTSYRQRFAAKDMVMLAWGENGLRHITNAKHPVTDPDSLKGLKLRLPQSDVMLVGFRALGANVAPLPFPQLYDALRMGTFDGQENPIATIMAAKFFQVQKHLTLSGHVYDPALLVMSPDLFDDLSVEDKANFIAAARLGATASRKAASEAEETGVAALRSDGMAVVADIDRAAFIASMASAVPEFETRFGHDAIERIRRLA